MKIIDISWPLTETMTQYKNVELFSATHINTPSSGAMETHITLCSHTGTHVDAPAHFIADGKTIEQIPLQKLLGTCRVFDLTNVQEKITHRDLEKLVINPDEIVILKTTNSFISNVDRFNPAFVYLTHEASQFLASKKIKALGFDYLGIERNQPDHPSHKAFMIANIPIIEGLRLIEVNPGTYFFCCMPLLLPGADAAPARAILIEDIV
jgi:arylformamidase